jgi:hypothetical protein
MASSTPSSHIFGVTGTHLFGVEKGMLHKRDFAVRARRYRLLAYSALDTVHFCITFVMHWLFITVAFNIRKGASRIDLLMTSKASKAFSVVLFVKGGEWITHRASASGTASSTKSQQTATCSRLWRFRYIFANCQ